MATLPEMSVSLWYPYLGAALAAVAVAVFGLIHSVKGPANAEIRALLSFLAACDDSSERSQAQARIVSLGERIRLARRHGVMDSWTLLVAIILFVVFALCLATAASLPQGIALCTLLSLLWMVVCTDAASCDVLDVDVFLIALFSAWVTTLMPAARWTTPEASVIGFLAIATLVFFVSTYFSAKRLVLRRPYQVVFGDGDTLLLFALAIYFGIDVVAILSLAALVFMLQQGCSFLRGQYQQGAPFVPAIYAGTALTALLPRPAWLDLNRVALDFIHSLQ